MRTVPLSGPARKRTLLSDTKATPVSCLGLTDKSGATSSESCAGEMSFAKTSTVVTSPARTVAASSTAVGG